MKLLHYIFALPLIVIAALVIYCAESNEGVSFDFGTFGVTPGYNTRLVLFLFLLYGYICGRVGAWFAHAPVRHELRRQKKANRALSKEQSKLNETVTGLQQNVATLQQEKAKAQAAASVNKETLGWVNKVKDKFATPKGAK